MGRHEQSLIEADDPLVQQPSTAAMPPSPEIAAFVTRPSDPQCIEAFRALLKRLDPKAPRSKALSNALLAALSAPNDDLREAAGFTQKSLTQDIYKDGWVKTAKVELNAEQMSLISALLYHRVVSTLPLELFLVALRQGLLEKVRSDAQPSTQELLLAEAMARHSFANEYIWDASEEEEAVVQALLQQISFRIEAGESVSAFVLFMVGAYRPLGDVPAIQAWVCKLSQQPGSGLPETLRLLVLDRLVETGIEIQAITPIGSEVSARVQAQYEENPYPRWRHLPTVPQFGSLDSLITDQVGPHPKAVSASAHHPKVLVAGAGTGRHPIQTAAMLPTAAVLAIDLSRASLAYAQREADARAVTNIAFAQADILNLSGVAEEFDLIESVGVLHHMKDPELGLATLVEALKPGGYLRLGLYSKTARGAVNAARAHLEDGDYAPGLSGIRNMRSDLMTLPEGHLSSLVRFRDFFATSDFRDLVLHVQEHQYDIPEIAELLSRNGLKFLGFTNPRAVYALEAMPQKAAKRIKRDLKAWHRYEQRHPDTFRDMYQFVCVKR